MGDTTTTDTNTNQTQYSTPWGPTGNILGQGLKDALWTYNSQIRNQDWDGYFNQGASGLYSLANSTAASNPLAGAMNEFSSTFGKDGYNQNQRDALSTLAGFSGGTTTNDALSMLKPYTTTSNNPALAGFTSMAGTQSPYASQQNLSGIAAGDYLNREDANFERVLDRSLERAATEAALVSGSAGRYGSGAHQGVVTRNVGDIAANARQGQYQYERNAQLQANQMLDAARSAQDATRLSALSGQAGTYADDRNRELSAINSYGALSDADKARQYQAAIDQFNMGQQGMSNLAAAGDVFSSLYAGQQMPYTDLMTLGQTPNNLISQLLGLTSYAQPYATQNATTSTSQEQQKDNTWGTLAGVASLL